MSQNTATRNQRFVVDQLSATLYIDEDAGIKVLGAADGRARLIFRQRPFVTQRVPMAVIRRILNGRSH